MITGDWQLESQPAYDQVSEKTNRSTRFDETVETIERTIDEALTAGADGMLHLGDLTEHRNPSSVESEAAAHLFARFLNPGGLLWGVAGNHDGAFFDISGSSFAPLAAMRAEQFTLFHKVTYDPTLRMIAVPYIHRATPAEIRAMIESAYQGHTITGPAFGAIHYGLQGAMVGAKNQVLPGDYLGPNELLVRPLDHIFAGHIHKAQEIAIGPAKGWHPGSSVICDMGERADRKTYILFDTVTREVQVREIPQRRRWVTVAYSPDIATKIPEWGADDLVKITGTFEKPDYPKATIEAAFKAGLPRPFALEVEVKPAKVERALRSLSVTSAGGLREALQVYVREKYPRFTEEPGLIGPATAAAMAALQEQGALTFCAEVEPTSIKIANFMTFISYEGSFMTGTPMLVAGENGVGKTNFFEAILWALTGKSSKGLDLSGVVRQGAQDTEVILELVGRSAEEEEQRFRIVRSVKLSKSGKPAQKLTLERWNKLQGAWDKTMSDGSQAEIQGRIDGLVGGSYLTLRTTNFKFQNDNSPFIRSHPSDRKAIIGEVTGLAPLNRAFKVLDEKRKESARAFQAGKDRLAGMVAAGEGNEEQVAQFKQDSQVAAAELAGIVADVPAREAHEAAARENQLAAKAKAQMLEGQLREQPNTEGKMLAAVQAVTTYENAYQSGRAEKVRQHNDLKGQITTAETELATAKMPTAEEIQALEIRAKDFTQARDSARDEKVQADTAMATLSAQKGNLTATVQTLSAGLNKAEADLTVLGVLPSQEEAQAAKAAAESEETRAVDACSAALQATMTAREAKKSIEEKIVALATEQKAVEAQRETLDATVQTASASLRKAEADLAVIGVLPSQEDVLTAKVAAESEETRAVDACSAALQATMTAREAKKTLEDKGKALSEEKKAFDGKDVGQCSRCGQAIDSSHIEKELARITAEQEANWTAVVEARSVSTQADADLVAASTRKSTAQAAAKAAAEAVHSLQLKAQAHQTLTAKVAELTEQVATAQVELGKKQTELAELSRKATELTSTLAAAELQASQADAAFVTASTRKTVAQAAAKAAAEAVHSLQLKAQAHQTLTVKVQELTEQVAKVQADLAVKVTEEMELANKIGALFETYLNATKQVKAVAAEVESASAAVQRVESTRGRLEALRTQLNSLTEAGIREKAEYESEVVRLKAAAEEAKKAHESQVVFTTILREQMDTARTEADQANAALTTAAVNLQALRSKVTAAEQRIKSIGENIARLEAQQGALVQARFELGVLKERAEIDEIAAGLLDARNGLPVYLIDQALPFLEDRINFYLGKLGMERLVVQLTTLAEDKETLAVLIDNGRPGPRLDVAAFSGGQLDRVEYGVKCALADLARQTRGVTFGLVCFDEPSGGLNATGKEALINLLYDRCATYPVTILTSHDEALIRAFHNQIRFGQGPAEETVVLGSRAMLNPSKHANALELKEDMAQAA
jgi:DNA repair exonuclease SbcCD ATPase subunit